MDILLAALAFSFVLYRMFLFWKFLKYLSFIERTEKTADPAMRPGKTAVHTPNMHEK